MQQPYSRVRCKTWNAEWNGTMEQTMERNTEWNKKWLDPIILLFRLLSYCSMIDKQSNATRMTNYSWKPSMKKQKSSIRDNSLKTWNKNYKIIIKNQDKWMLLDNTKNHGGRIIMSSYAYGMNKKMLQNSHDECVQSGPQGSRTVQLPNRKGGIHIKHST